MTAIDQYRDAVVALLRDQAANSGPFEEASAVLTRSLEDGGVLHVFGSGHSMLPAIDATFRAGGLAPVNLLFDPALAPWEPTRVSRVERLEGYGSALASLQDLRRGEMLVVISHSGINPVPIEVAQYGREQGLSIVAITSSAHSLAETSRHPDGLRLLDVADIVLDTGAPAGDVTLTLESGLETGPTSTILATFLLHSLVIGAIERLTTADVSPPVLRSMNRAGGDDTNATAIAPYRERLSRVP